MAITDFRVNQVNIVVVLIAYLMCQHVSPRVQKVNLDLWKDVLCFIVISLELQLNMKRDMGQ